MSETAFTEILDFHGILYAHTHKAENYAYDLDSRSVGREEDGVIKGGVLEIGFVEKIPLVFRREDGSEYTASEGDVFVIPPMSRLEVRAARPGIHRHVTVESSVDCRVGRTPGERAIALPPVIDGAICDKAAQAIRRAAGNFSPASDRGWFGQCADFTSILSALEAALSGRSAGGSSPSRVRYCREAEEFVRANITRKLTVAEVARHVGINKNYLTNIFSETTGTPMIEYINRLKLGHIAELIVRRGCGIREAAEQVGIDNVNYVSRMFRKYYGVTVSQYKRTVM